MTIARIGDYSGTAVVISRTGYSGELGYEIFCDKSAALEIWERTLGPGHADVAACHFNLGRLAMARHPEGSPPELDVALGRFAQRAQLGHQPLGRLQARSGPIARMLPGVDRARIAVQIGQLARDERLASGLFQGSLLGGEVLGAAMTSS